MGNLLARFFDFIGSFVAHANSAECVVWVLDEPEMPKSLIEK